MKPEGLSAIANGTGGYVLLTGPLNTDGVMRLAKYFVQVLAGVTHKAASASMKEATREWQRKGAFHARRFADSVQIRSPTLTIRISNVYVI